MNLAVTMDFRAECCFCEHFDGGGLARVLKARQGEIISGDCLGPGDVFEPRSNHCCENWNLDSTPRADVHKEQDRDEDATS